MSFLNYENKSSLLVTHCYLRRIINVARQKIRPTEEYLIFRLHTITESERKNIEHYCKEATNYKAKVLRRTLFKYNEKRETTI
jgi:hypothetical protein